MNEIRFVPYSRGLHDEATAGNPLPQVSDRPYCSWHGPTCRAALVATAYTTMGRQACCEQAVRDITDWWLRGVPMREAS